MNEAYHASLKVITTLESHGYQAYWVGGCVRDRLLGKEPVDYDVTTDAHPETVQRLFSKTVPTGLQHGTVAVIQDGQMTEVTTFRQETGFTDHRRPRQVTFVKDLSADLSRRDFTINAMAQDRYGNLYDPFKGAEDLKRKVIRAVGKADMRFQEDALRMVRALRFMAQLSFQLDAETEEALLRQKKLMRYLAVERVTMEFHKLWKTRQPSQALELLWRKDLFSDLPPFHRWNPSTLDPSSFTRLDDIKDPQICWALLLYLYGARGPDITDRLHSLRLSSKEVAFIRKIYQLALGWHLTESDEKDGKRLLLSEGLDVLSKSLITASRMYGWEKGNVQTLQQALKRWYREMPVHGPEDLQLNGQILLESVGRKPGPWIGQVIQVLLEKVALGEISNQRELLIQEGCRLVQDS
ncbi:CCA tRNA nucleotidyltransferase [Melghirimyces algeriensis]|uniref:tRNA nucleotidyltransferase (CCA-adding enzyme) n=1 Tax=Melghirimyces algeriensis TaxID=910412 RepID=A0A521B803_9BACL|nr:CCA tRNA nucleotidyltransferase [Melghirimyces algeriensis]SMO43228.1 tRNA nucleotidyltransferase (CCA-adding enzyme) [Melghirimyces algeriensis]